MNERGKIIHPDRKQQINDFSGLIYGKITPTDLDGVIEYQDKAYIFFEIKYMDTELPFGQKLAIQRLVNDTSYNGKQSIAIVAKHNIYNTQNQISVAECVVREIYLSNEKKWRKTNGLKTVKQCIDYFLNKYIHEYSNTS